MLPYTEQLRYKEREVLENLTRLGKVSLPPVMPIIGADADGTRYYRNKLEFTFSNRRYKTKEEMTGPPSFEEDPALGFHVPKLFDKVIDIQECHLQGEPSDTIRNTVRDFALEQGYPFYDIRRHTGWLRNLIVRVCSTGEVMVNLCVAYEDSVEGPRLMDHLLEKVPSITTLLYTVNPKWNDSIFDLEPVVYHGNGYITEQLGDFRFKIGPKSFFQTNTRQAEKLYSVVRDFAGLTGKETVYDLYCGTGSIGIFLSKQAGRVVGVEVIAEAIRDAGENAALNGISHATFLTGDVVDVCDDAFFARHGRPDLVITDPPRAGMHEKLVRKLLEIAAPRIIYVSCNVATQARDLQLLDEHYRVTRVQPVDLFPHTHHIENVVELEWR